MHITASTPTTGTTPSARRRCRVVSFGTTASLAALVLIAVPAVRGTAAAAPHQPLGGCTLTPTANSIAFDVTALMTTVRMTDGVIEMLHDAQCTDGRSGTVWITANII